MICKTNIPIIKITSGGGGGGEGYIRTEGVPDGESIIANAPDFEVEGVVYKPIYYLALRDTFITKTFSKTGTGVSTGADAFVFSDEPTTIYVGDTTHTFDVTKDFETDESWKCRYLICYATADNKASTSGITINLYSYKNTFEFIGASETIIKSSSSLFGYQSLNNSCQSIEYVNIENSSIVNNGISAQYFLSNNYALKTIKLPSVNKITSVLNSNLFNRTKANIDLSSVESIGSSDFLRYSTINNVNMPLLQTITGDYPFADMVSLKYIDLSSLTTWTGATSTVTLNYTIFIKLPTDFDFNTRNLTGKVSKSYEWLNVELPTKLKDNSGGTAKTLTIGSANIALITPANQAIIANKNWTLL